MLGVVHKIAKVKAQNIYIELFRIRAAFSLTRSDVGFSLWMMACGMNEIFCSIRVSATHVRLCSIIVQALVLSELAPDSSQIPS